MTSFPKPTPTVERGAAGPSNKVAEKKDKKPVKDDYYDRRNYYYDRNIFSSNEPFDPQNRIYTNQASNMHSVWTSAIGVRMEDGPPEDFEETNKVQQKREFTNKFLNELNKMNALNSSNTIGCKKCNHIGHLDFQCRNMIKLPKKEAKIDNSKDDLLNKEKIFDRDDDDKDKDKDQKEKKKKHKKDKREKKDKKEKKHKKEKRHKKEKKHRERKESLSRSSSSSSISFVKETKEKHNY